MYCTIIKSTENKIVIEKSKFIAYVYNCNSQEEQSTILKNLRREHLSATHICYASIYFQNNQLLNYSSDDREPSGTAGLQILQALKENKMVNVFCAVVRYFGGIKLGVAGLGRAYKDSALSVIKENKKNVTLKTKCFLKCDYNQYSSLRTWLDKNNLNILESVFDKNISLSVYLNNDEAEIARKMVQDLKLSQNEQMYC